MSPSHDRTGYVITLWREGLWGRWIAAGLSIYGLFSAFRDEVVPAEQEGGWRLVKMIPAMSLDLWLAICAFVLAGWIFEAAYRAQGKARRSVHRLEQELRLLPTEPASQLALSLTQGVSVYWSPESIGRDGVTILPQGPVMLGFELNIRNIGDTPLNDCQMRTRFSHERTPDPVRLQTPLIEASAPFALRPRESRDFPIFGLAQDFSAPLVERVLFHEVNGNWTRSTNAPPLPAGRYTLDIEVHSISTLPNKICLCIVPRQGAFEITGSNGWPSLPPPPSTQDVEAEAAGGA